MQVFEIVYDQFAARAKITVVTEAVRKAELMTESRASSLWTNGNYSGVI